MLTISLGGTPEFPDPPGWALMTPGQKREVVRPLLTLAWVQSRYRGSLTTPEAIHARLLSDLDAEYVPEPHPNVVCTSLDYVVDGLLRRAKERIAGERNRISGIYKLSREGVEGFYVGRTLSIQSRMKAHCGRRPVNKGIVHALRKDGVFVNAEGVRVEILELMQGASIEAMRAREQHYISTLRPPWNARNEIARAAGIDLSAGDT